MYDADYDASCAVELGGSGVADAAATICVCYQSAVMPVKARANSCALSQKRKERYEI